METENITLGFDFEEDSTEIATGEPVYLPSNTDYVDAALRELSGEALHDEAVRTMHGVTSLYRGHLKKIN